MKRRDILPVWWHVLRGRTPFLSIEITKECPLRCPGCYAYGPDHLNNGVELRRLGDFRGADLVARITNLIAEHRPVHLSIVGGEPLVRYRELCEILPLLDRMGVETQVVTSAVRPIPETWRELRNLHLVVSVDGLAAEHDQRRSPATYGRILRNINGHRVIIHCTITRQLSRPGYLRDFCDYWTARIEARKIWFSLYTPQDGERSAERLSEEDRRRVLLELASLRHSCSKLDLPEPVLEGYARAPKSPETCVFSQITTCISADLNTHVSPCQFGGKPVCSECGCAAAAGMTAVGRHRLAGVISLYAIFALSRSIGRRFMGRAR